MKKNRLLDFAMFICKLFCLIQVILFLLLSFFVVYWHINPGYFGIFNFGPLQSTFGYTFAESWTTASHTAPFAYNNIIPVSLYFSYIQLSSIFLLVFLAFKKFNDIIQSVRLTQTFKKQNVRSFRMIGKYFLLIFLLSSFSIIFFEQGRFYGLFINFTPLFLMCTAYIMAEIFDQGNNLLEDSQLTV